MKFQMNRFYGWANEHKMLDEMRQAGKRISTYDDWTGEMLQLSDHALEEERLIAAAYYSRGAQFFLVTKRPGLDAATSLGRQTVERLLRHLGAVEARGHDIAARQFPQRSGLTVVTDRSSAG